MAPPSTEPTNVPFFKKKRARPSTARQRTPDAPADAPAPAAAPAAASTNTPAASTSASASQVVLPARKPAASLLSAGTKRPAAHRDSEGEGDGERADAGPSVNWGARGGGGAQGVARDILAGDAAEALRAKRARVDPSDGDFDRTRDDGLYRGVAGYSERIASSKDVPKALRAGPQRAPVGSVIKTVTMVDYQPDVCKDYKETGFCGFGDTCKFLHDRGTYLQGWQLDKLAAATPTSAGDADAQGDSDDEAIPFKCVIGRHAYTDPVVTRCGHYFCTACALRRYARTPKCAACGAATGGIFNRADKVIARMKRMRAEKGEGRVGGGGEKGAAAGGDVRIEGLGEGSGSEEDGE
ncbi:hypothetical protein FA95DRAFT_1503749 [Auriscalpium vulgare]|uniref:Uncharacterized protein n=1 Tax=Auriscalpium vulgare TaxID=40419 RepID=A0ACB8R6M0_9AGAM|nr:hypothetical protein FA95DRAFT_1503749 [Auriscalpium vulgare]